MKKATTKVRRGAKLNGKTKWLVYRIELADTHVAWYERNGKELRTSKPIPPKMLRDLGEIPF
jgi:hypothetical protein